MATVYLTALGPTYLAHIGPHAHGDMDFPDTGHRLERPGRDFVDTLQAAWSDDDLPAWCDCGNRTLSRMRLVADIDAGRRKVLVN